MSAAMSEAGARLACPTRTRIVVARVAAASRLPHAPGVCLRRGRTGLGATARPHAQASRARSLVVCAAETATDMQELHSMEDFDTAAASTPQLVILNCSTSWCGPCKIFLPKYVEMAKEFSGKALFLKIQGDENPSTVALMKRLGVRAVPSFFFFKGGEQVKSFAGSNETQLRDTIKSFLA